MGNACFRCSTIEEKEEEEEHNHHERINSPPDRISDLPDEISHHILSFLPFKSAAQTCVLSRTWSHLWSSYPIIDLYKVFLANDERIINTTLACRDKQYNVQVSRVGGDVNDPFLRGCTVGMVAERVEKLEVEISMNENRGSDMPSQCRLQCDSLRTIKFKTSSIGSNSEIWLEFPSSYVIGSYLRSLHSLTLIKVNFLDNILVGDLFSGSSFPCLKVLKVRSCRGITDLKITSPNLEYLLVCNMDITDMNICGMRLESLIVEYIKCMTVIDSRSCVNIFAPNLQYLSWFYNEYMTENGSIKKFPALKTLILEHASHRMQMYQSCVVNFLLASFHALKSLTISDAPVQILSKIYFEGGLPFSFTQLEELRIRTYLDKTAIPGVACLFKSSPVVHTLKIRVMNAAGLYNDNKWDNTVLDDANCTEYQYWETQAQNLSPFLSHLTVVEITFGSGHIIIPETERAINLARFLLKYGRSLQQIKLISLIYPPLISTVFNDTVALTESFPRASAYVKFSTYCYGM